MGYSLAINGICVQRRFAGLPVVMAGGLAVCKLSSGIVVQDVSSEKTQVWMVPVHDGLNFQRWEFCDLEHEKGIRWMPWHQEAMKDVARCEKPWGAASRR